MALHAKLQLSARHWRAPLWPVVLSLCDWLTGWGGGRQTSLPPSLPPSILSPFLSFPPSSFISCCKVSLRPGLALLPPFLPPPAPHPPLSLLWHNSSNFSSNVMNIWRHDTVLVQFFSASDHCGVFCRVKERNTSSFDFTSSFPCLYLMAYSLGLVKSMVST